MVQPVFRNPWARAVGVMVLMANTLVRIFLLAVVFILLLFTLIVADILDFVADIEKKEIEHEQT